MDNRHIETIIDGVEDNGHITVTGMTIGGLKVDNTLWGFYLVTSSERGEWKELIRVGVEGMDERIRGLDAIEKWLRTAGAGQQGHMCKVCEGLLSECGSIVAYVLIGSINSLEAFAIGAGCFNIIEATMDVIQHMSDEHEHT